MQEKRSVLHFKIISSYHNIISYPKMPEAMIPLTKVLIKCTKDVQTIPSITDKTTQDMPQIKIICIHIVKLISVDFESVFMVFAIFWCFVQRIPNRISTISNCTIRKHFLCFIDTVILGISNWEIVYLNMFSKIHWKNGEVGLSYT